MVFVICITVPGLRADEEGAQKILKEGLVGAAVGGIAASASGGKAGKGALIGAGTHIAGQAILGALSGSGSSTTSKKGVSHTHPTEEITLEDAYQRGYQEGYQKGFQDGFQQGYQQGLKQPTFRE